MKINLRQHLETWNTFGIKELYISKAQSEPQLQPCLTTTEKNARLAQCQADYAHCQACPLWRNRKRFVYGEGNPDAVCMIVGEAPGEQENQQGRPFVGAAGQLLDKMLFSIDIIRGDVYIANIVKCRPPLNRNPEQAERLACLPYLIEQINIIRPRVFLFLGLVAAQTLLQTNAPMHRLRETTHLYRGTPVWVTYHPSALLHNPNNKRPAWEDLKRFKLAYQALLAEEQLHEEPLS